MFRVSCIQLKSNNNILHNLKITERLISKAVKQKSDFILTPETSSLFSLEKKSLLKICKSMREDIYLNGIKKLAKKYKKWILIGSVITKLTKNKLVNRSLLIDKTGKIRTYYDKIHMYDVKISKQQSYQESKTYESGQSAKIAKLKVNGKYYKIGMTICYDLRFPNLFRDLALNGAELITVPSVFMHITGKDHWHSLLKSSRN